MKSQCPSFDDEKVFKREKAWELNLYIDNKMIAYQDYDLKLKLKILYVDIFIFILYNN